MADIMVSLDCGKVFLSPVGATFSLTWRHVYFLTCISELDLKYFFAAYSQVDKVI
jgi:hypothetical protein